ncbi:transmembrane protein 266 isoform X2 [Falco rusticolus]|uniref:transmembrane protein 266 isoform X2 n=1 Tax=Falco rusticolus TaxID=120794 RepID=UPI000FFBDFBE|nr:transmembrane protein 266 isoform X2 [Falco rusticolus]XP_055571585.1 transmembrane protein 266 isoform X2 [Falco cherrug]XP_055661720.1 transmembrane protein 266 isoform X2 [Falco peregrinus]
MTNPQPTIEGGVSEVEIISQQVEEETKSIAPVQLVNFAYRDLPLAALDLSVAGSQLLSNLDEEYQREGSNWLKPCCGRRAAVWQVFLLSASLNSFLVACVVLVVILLTLELLIDIKLLQSYVLPVKVEMEMMIQQYEKAKVIQDEQLERLTQICQEQGFEIRQLRAHLAQQDLDLAAEREAALQVPHVLNKQSSKRYKVVAIEDSDDEATENITELRPPREDDMNNYISRYYNEPSSDSGIPEAAICMVTTAAIDVHRPNISSDLFTVEVPMRLGSTGTSASITSGSASRSTVSSGTQACSEISQTLGSSPDCSEDAAKAGASPQADLVPAQQRVAQAMVQELLSSLSEEACLAQKGLDPVNLKLPSPACSAGASPDLGHRLSVYNRKNQESLDVFQLKPLITCPQGAPAIDEKYGALGPPEPRLGRVPEA